MMRKVLVVITLILMMSTAGYGGVSEDMSVYVRKDVFDAKMEAFMNEIRGEFQVMNAKIESLSRRIDDNYHSLESRINDVQNYIYLILVLLGIIAGLPTVQKMYQSMKDSRSAVTLEDVKRLIEENNVRLLERLQA